MKIKTYLKVLIPLSVIGTVLRVLELLYSIEKDTGYYLKGSPFRIVTDVFSLAVFIFLYTMTFVVRKEGKPVRSRLGKISGFSKFMMLVAGLASLLISGFDFFPWLILDFRIIDAADILKNPSLYALILSVFSLVFFVVYSSSPKTAVKKGWVIGLGLSVPLFLILRFIVKFFALDQFVHRVYASYEIVFIGILILGFTNTLKLMAGLTNRRGFSLFAMSTVYFGCLHLVDVVFSLLPASEFSMSGYDKLYETGMDLNASMLYTVFAVVIITYFAATMRRSKKENSDETETSVTETEVASGGETVEAAGSVTE